MTIKQGDYLTVVNCESFVSLRSRADGNYTSGRRSIKLHDTVTFVQTAGNGFYIVDYQGKTGFILAPYLSPGVFGDPVSEAAYDRAFSQNDLTVNGIELGRSQRLDVINQYGSPVITEETNTSIVLKYNDFSVTFNNSGHTASRVDIYNFNARGPRNICVGMNLAEALNTFPMNNSRILSGSMSHDLILYSNTNEVLDPPYAVIRNYGEGGNGIIEFYDPIMKAHMEIIVLNSRVRKISVYMEQ